MGRSDDEILTSRLEPLGDGINIRLSGAMVPTQKLRGDVAISSGAMAMTMSPGGVASWLA